MRWQQDWKRDTSKGRMGREFVRDDGPNDGPQKQKPRKYLKLQGFLFDSGGGGEIRTHGRVTPSPVFKTGAFNHSATPPEPRIVT
jgi:hypothetical protein